MQRVLRAGLRARGRQNGFTLLEVMAVIMIIGILSAFLLPNVMDMLSRSKVSACEANMRELYKYFLMYQSSNEGRLPRDTGQKFFLRLWKDAEMERSEKNSRRFFCPDATYGDVIEDPENPIPIEEYLSDWEAVGPAYTTYAGFDDYGDRALRRMLTAAPSKVTILADADLNHRNNIVYMTADGEVHVLNIAQLVDDGILDQADVDARYLPLGPGSPIEALRTVSNE